MQKTHLVPLLQWGTQSTKFLGKHEYFCSLICELIVLFHPLGNFGAKIPMGISSVMSPERPVCNIFCYSSSFTHPEHSSYVGTLPEPGHQRKPPWARGTTRQGTFPRAGEEVVPEQLNSKAKAPPEPLGNQSCCHTKRVLRAGPYRSTACC